MDQVFIEFDRRVGRMNDLTLSICIATCNRTAFIGATLESIIFQATEEVEVVIVNVTFLKSRFDW
jgi:hypothetical protein